MRKLSEIGTEVWPYAVDGHTVEFLLSIEERRELVVGAIYNYLLDHVDSYSLKDGENHEERMKKFFEEQGI